VACSHANKATKMDDNNIDMLTTRDEFFFFLRFYLLICKRERDRTQAEGAAGRGGSRLPAEQGAQCGTYQK